MTHLPDVRHDGSVDEGIGIATVLNGGGQFNRKGFASHDEFWAVADATHLDIFGTRLQFDKEAAL